MQKNRFRTGFEEDYDPSRFATINDEPSLTHQSFKDECDVNRIFEKLQDVGFVDHVNPIKPNYIDLADAVDYHAALNLVIAAQEAFEELPAKIRKRFDNDPSALLEFVHDEKNRDEAIELGLIERPVNAYVSPAGPTKSGGTDPSLDVTGTTDTNN